MSRNKKLIAETRLTVLCKTIERLSLTNKGTHMTCKRCPHHVKHGQIASDGKSMVFKDLCGLRLKQTMDPETTAKKTRSRGRPPAEIVPRKPLPPGQTTDCINFPFDEQFDYFTCTTYQEIFASKGIKNGAVPTRDFQYSEKMTGIPVTDMELL